MILRSFENQAGMLAIMMMDCNNVLITRMKIELALEKFGDYAISNVKKDKEVVFNTDLPYQLYHEKKDAVRSRKKQMS